MTALGTQFNMLEFTMPETPDMFYLEDDVVLANVTRNALSKRGYNVLHCDSIEAALAAIQCGPYDYAILDLKLEDGSSLALIESMIELWPHIKIVVLTGYASIATAVQAIKYGAVNYLSKPASIDQILRAFENQEDPTDSDDANSVALARIEWEYIQQTLQNNDGNISATARHLKMHRRTLQRKLNKKPSAE
jgi:two-component system, response regulator RegA